MAEAFLALGSNLGDRSATLRESIDALGTLGVRVIDRSTWRVTQPVGGPPQPDFLNGALRVDFGGSPFDLLLRAQSVERRLGRVRTVPLGPRTLDLDLLWFAGAKLESEFLALPHPRMLERAFVLEPLAEVAPRLEIDGRTVCEHLASLD